MACVELNKPCGEFLRLEMDMSKKFYGSLVLGAAMLVGGQQMAMAANQVVVQENLAPGATITVGGIKYQIVQFEVPSFENDKIYLVKFPMDISSTTYVSGHVSVYGSTTGQQPFMDNTINAGSTGLNGFKAFYDEGYNYNASYTRYSGQSSLNNNLLLTNNVGIQIDNKTFVALSLASKSTSQTVNTTAAAPDTTTKLKATPTAMTRSLRNKFLLDSRALFKYVSIKEKI